MAEMPSFEQVIRMEIVYRVPGMETVFLRRGVPYANPGGEALMFDLYRPAGPAETERLPAVVLIHGGPIPRIGAKNMGVFTSFGRLLAASGLAAVAFDHRFLAAERFLDAAEDVESLVRFLRGHAGELGIDGD